MYAGFWKRFAAYIVDIIIINIGVLIFIFIWALFELFLNLIGLEQKTKEMVLGLLGVPIYLSIPWLYYTLLETSKYKATLGKMAVGIIVVNENYSKISFARANARYWSKILSCILLIGFIMAGLTRKKQALHDCIAGTIVIKKNYNIMSCENISK